MLLATSDPLLRARRYPAHLTPVDPLVESCGHLWEYGSTGAVIVLQEYCCHPYPAKETRHREGSRLAKVTQDVGEPGPRPGWSGSRESVRPRAFGFGLTATTCLRRGWNVTS